MKSIKILFFCFLVVMVSCTKEEIVPIPTKTDTDIFSVSESSVSNGDVINFNLTSDSTYVLKLIDKTTNQVISKERIIGKVGENKLNIYTKSLQNTYLYLVLEDNAKREIKKTTVIVK